MFVTTAMKRGGLDHVDFPTAAELSRLDSQRVIPIGKANHSVEALPLRN